MSDKQDPLDGVDGKVLVGPFTASEARIADPKTSKGYRGYCRHIGWEIDPEARTITCKRCDATLEPFGLLLGYAKGERAWKNWNQAADEARRSVAALKKEAVALKAQMRSHSRKNAEAAVAEEKKRATERNSRSAWNARRIAVLAAKIQRAMEQR